MRRTVQVERWRVIEDLFVRASEYPADRVVAFLEEACPDDPELRRQVESLLSADREAEMGLQAVVNRAAVSVGTGIRQNTPQPIGSRIGPYEVIREIGRGGMGTVYQAVRRDDQYLRSVAIKCIAPGFEHADLLPRFRTERQILATLQHPNIAALLDGGATEDGRPYIVMEYIEGEPLLEYCRHHDLSIAERLELFCSICSAVQHAHQMLVIHRDIKPANVLVTSDGIPKLLDFGIAKLMAPELVPGTAEATKTIARRLTPQYASPEQIRGEPLTTTTDVYSLGVLLYELLTFATPYRVTGRSPHEIEVAVCNTEPVRLGLAAGNDARLRRQLSGDLENIVAMALRKEPQRRYSSPQQFSEDIRRYLKGMPVSAREDTVFYRAGKLIRRNKLASAAFTLLAISVVAGCIATLREARRTQVRFQDVRQLANSVLFDFEARIRHLPGATPVREHVVKTALEYLNKLSTDASGDPSLQWELAQAYERIGDAQGDPEGPNLGHFRAALSSYGSALSLVNDLAKSRRDYETLSCLAWLHYKSGDLQFRTGRADQALAHYSRGLDLATAIGRKLEDSRADYLLLNGFQRLAAAQMRVGANSDALTSARLAEQAATRAERSKPGAGAQANLARSWILLGNTSWIAGDLQGAWTTYQRAIRAFENLIAERPQSTRYLHELQEAYRRAGDLSGNPAHFHFSNPERAIFYYRKALDIVQREAARDPNDALAQSQHSMVLRRMAAVLRLSKPAEAAALYRRAATILRELMRRAPEDLSYRRELANTQLGLAHALHRSGNTPRALEEVEIALAMHRKLLQQNPGRPTVREDLFESLLARGEFRLASNQPDAALEGLNEALATAESLTEQRHNKLYPERCLALAYEKLGEYYQVLASRTPPSARARHMENADQWYGRALAIWSRWRRENVAVPYSSVREHDVRREQARLAERRAAMADNPVERRG